MARPPKAPGPLTAAASRAQKILGAIQLARQASQRVMSRLVRYSALIRRYATWDRDKPKGHPSQQGSPLPPDMAIYHVTAKIISRKRGQSAVAKAAYRSGSALFDKHYGITQDYSRKVGVAHTEILAPEGAPAWMLDRQSLWNGVEASEKRKDAQLARELEIALPIELTHDQSVELLRDYIRTQFVAKGMVADFAVHRDNPNNPHAHIMLTTRAVKGEGFGPKVREWNATAQLLGWRAAWADTHNLHMARAGHAVRIDHRTLDAQHIELTPGKKIGVGQERQTPESKIPRHIAERIETQSRIARENGATIIADPTVALHAITHQRSTFTHHDIAKWLHTRTDGAAQFDAAYLKVTAARELVPLGRDDRRRMRYTTRDMLEAEKSMLSRAAAMTTRRGHGVAAQRQLAALTPSTLSAEQRVAFEHVTGEGDIKAIVGVAGSGKSTMLEAARRAWEMEGLTVKGAALSGIAAENLQTASGISSRTLASYEWSWKDGRYPLTKNDVLVIDEAGMIGTKQLERILAHADKARAKVVLVGDPEQLQAIEAGAPFRGIVGEVGMVELTQVRRQHHPWARDATQSLATGQTLKALAAYEHQGAITATVTKSEARTKLLDAWSADTARALNESRLILAYTREDVRDLNAAAREIRKSRHELGHAEVIATTRGPREMAVNDRIVFLRNEKSLGVKNGSLGTLETIERGVLVVRLDGTDDARIVVESRDYQDLDHGYATTVHKSQGATVDRSYILASRYFDRHTSYVALSRHREAAMLYYSNEEFVPALGPAAAIDPTFARERFQSTLSRARHKELAHDYLDRDLSDPAAPSTPTYARYPATSEEIRAAAVERWAAFRAEHPGKLPIEREEGGNYGTPHFAEKDRGREHRPDDDLSL
jgi:Ti-type conjugative transfer relaxase TraA